MGLVLGHFSIKDLRIMNKIARMVHKRASRCQEMKVRDYEMAYKAATMYYLQNVTMDVIARNLGVSRSTVSRMIREARDQGLVHISVHAPQQSGIDLGSRISSTFGVKAHVVPVRRSHTESQRLEQVARVSAHLLGDWFGDGMILGIAWGNTVSALVRHLTPKHTYDSSVVQLNGATNRTPSGQIYASQLVSTISENFNAASYHFPVPAFFDYAETKEAMWRERSVRRVLDKQRRANIALFGVGALSANPPSHVYSAGYLDPADLKSLSDEKVVGDVCTVLLRADGSYRDITLNSRASGPSPHALQSIERRLCVVIGERKVPALVGALRARVATDLILDDITARALLDTIKP